MTVQTPGSVTPQYIGNGATSVYAYGFRILTAAELVVTQTDTAGVETTLVLTTHYTLSGVGVQGGGNITLVAPLPSNYLLVGRSVLSLLQSTDLRNQGTYQAEIHEDVFDRLTRMVQQVNERMDRAVKISNSEVGSAVATTLPAVSVRKSKFLAFDASGNVIAAAGTSANLGPVSAFIDTLLDDADAATARATLGTVSLGSTPSTQNFGDSPAGGVATTASKNDHKHGMPSASVDLPRSYLAGFGLANNATDATNDIDIAIGAARNAADTANIGLASALTKRLDAAWAVGTNQGGLDTGAIGDSVYHVWAIKRSDTGVVDVLFSLSATAPTMPTNYDSKRRIGSIIRATGAIRLFSQFGDEFLLASPVEDVDVTNPGTAALTLALTVPTGVKVYALFNALAQRNSGNFVVYISSLDQNDEAAGSIVAPLNNLYAHGALSQLGASGRFRIRTNISAQIRARLSASGASDTLEIATLGWEDRRGRDD